MLDEASPLVRVARALPSRPRGLFGGSAHRTRLALVIAVTALLVSGFAGAVPSPFEQPGPTSGAPLVAAAIAGGPPYPCLHTDNHPNVTLASYQGAGFSTVTITGTDFYLEGSVSLYWVSGPLATGNYVRIGYNETNYSGGFTGPFTLPPQGPASPAGRYNVTVQDAIDQCASANYTLTSGTPRVPQLTIEFPTSGLVGTATTLNGTYFASEATISAVTIGPDAVGCSGGSPVTSVGGSFNCDFTVPDSLPPGTYTMTAYDAADGVVTSTNSFEDLGGETGTGVSCSPNPFGVLSGSIYSHGYEYSTNCTAGVSGSSPTGVVTWSSTSSTGSFFTWTVIEGSVVVTPTTTCELAGSGQCTVSYADTSLGSPTITGSYGGDGDNAPSVGTEVVTVTSITAPTVTSSCNPSAVTKSTTCTAVVTGNGPTGAVVWAAETYMDGYIPWGSFSPTACELVDGACSTTYTSGAYSPSCNPEGPETCYGIIDVHASYQGDSLNSPASDYFAEAMVTKSVEYDAYTPGTRAIDGPWDNTSGAAGGFGTQTVSSSEHASYTSGDPPVTSSDVVNLVGTATTGEESLVATSQNGGSASGSVTIGDLVSVSGMCNLPSNPEPTNLLDCVGISVAMEGTLTGTCTGGMDGDACDEAYAWVLGSYSMWDVDASFDLLGVGVQGSVGNAACAGGGCSAIMTAPAPCPNGMKEPYGVCVPGGGDSFDFQSPTPLPFPAGSDIRSGDTFAITETLAGGVAVEGMGIAVANIDPVLEITNLDPASVTVAVSAAQMDAAENPSVLQVSTEIAPSPVAAGSPVVDTTVLTNAGTSALTAINASGSSDGALSCPSTSLAAGGQETCTGAFVPAATGSQVDYIVANGTNASAGDVNNGTTSPFFVTPVPYPVTFGVTGLPAKSSWTVLVDGEVQNSSSPTITFALPYGPYTYEIVPPAGEWATPTNGSFFVYASAVDLTLMLAAGPAGPVVAAVEALYTVYEQNAELRTELPDANGSLVAFEGLVSWAGSIVDGSASNSAYAALAPYGFWYTLLSVYNSRVDLQSLYGAAYTSWSNFTGLVTWAGEVVNGSFADSSRSTLEPFAPWYVLMETYNARPDLQSAFPGAYTNLTNYSRLVNWAGGVVTGAFADSDAATLTPFGYSYALMLVYDGRADLQSAFPDAFSNEGSYQGLVAWAGAVVNGSFVDSSQSTLLPFGYWYVLFGWVYEDRADLQSAFAHATTDGDSYAELVAWADEVVLGDFTDSADSTLLPFASSYGPR